MTKKLILGMLIVGLAQCAGYLWALHVEGGFGFGCCDQACYAQGALRIAEGHPFSYAPGVPPSTGQTSTLYPFVLSAFSWGDLNTASAVLAAVFYLVFLACWGVVIAELIPPRGPARFAAAALVSLSGGIAHTAFAQCDQGLWMAVSAAAAAALACRRYRTYVAILVLAPWVRPEGMMLIAATVVGAIVAGRQECRPNARARLFPLLLPILSAAGVFALNYALTGHAAFSSMDGKGHFHVYPFWTAVGMTLSDGLKVALAHLCSIPTTKERFLALVSPVASVGFWIGFATLFKIRAWWRTRAFVFFLAAAMAVGAVATSGFAYLDYDRYFAWLLPIPYLTAGWGLAWLTERIPSPFWRKLPIVALVVTTLPFTGFMIGIMSIEAPIRTDFFRDLREQARHLPPGADVGGSTFNLAYGLPRDCRFRDVQGFFAPDFRGNMSNFTRALEQLKHDPSVRFDYWASQPPSVPEDTPRMREVLRVVCGEPFPPGEKTNCFYKADWSAYDRGAEPPAQAPLAPVARLDVCHAPDEAAAEMRTAARTAEESVNPLFVARRPSDGAWTVEAGRQIGRELAFRLPVATNRAARLVLRTSYTDWAAGREEAKTERKPGERDEELAARTARDEAAHADDSCELTLELVVDGATVARERATVRRRRFTDVVFEIPAAALRTPRPQFVLRGRHAACAIWLYQ